MGRARPSPLREKTHATTAQTPRAPRTTGTSNRPRRASATSTGVEMAAAQATRSSANPAHPSPLRKRNAPRKWPGRYTKTGMRSVPIMPTPSTVSSNDARRPSHGARRERPANLRLHVLFEGEPQPVAQLPRCSFEVRPGRTHVPWHGRSVSDPHPLAHHLPDVLHKLPDRGPRPAPDVVDTGHAFGLRLQCGHGGARDVREVGHLSALGTVPKDLTGSPRVAR